jgi:transcriptional regulator with XRE-family HTH domain
MQRFGEKLRRLRMQRGLTVRELAVALGYSAKSNSYISETETGKRRPKIEFVLKVAHYFGVTTARSIRLRQAKPASPSVWMTTLLVGFGSRPNKPVVVTTKQRSIKPYVSISNARR